MITEKMPLVFQVPFLKKMVLVNNLNDFIDDLKKYSNLHGFKYEDIVYSFTFDSLKKDFFFKYNENIKDYLFFESFKWATANENRQKDKPLSIKDIVVKKKIKYFVNLNVAFITAFNKYYASINKIDSPQYKVELEKYCTVIYEISYVKKNKS